MQVMDEDYEPKIGDLCVWHIPQVPGEPFQVKVDSVKEAKQLINVLDTYDLFELDHRIKPDYCNATGLNVYVADSDGEGNPGWETWYSEEGMDIDDVDENGNPLDEPPFDDEPERGKDSAEIDHDDPINQG